MNEVIEQPERAVANAVNSPSDLLRIAVEQGADLDRLEKLMALQERWEANQARKAYVQDMAEFKKNPPEILKKSQVSYETKDGGLTEYRHASLGDVNAATCAALAKHGFSHRWNTEQGDGGMVTVTCILTHVLGHSESTTLRAGMDLSGGKNNIQAVASTVTYLQRYTLLSACGLATQDMDDDGRVGGDAPIANELAEQWIERANAAISIDALESTWKMGVKEITDANNKEAYRAFKAAVQAKKVELLEKEPS